jgi:UDP-N-acetylmuramoyl-tripeptide--D-alanyl-D-alanine ligase
VPQPGPAGSLLIDDTYNANPASTRAALEVLDELAEPGRRIAVLGDMLELGRAAAEAHRGIGARARASELALLVTVGEGGGLIDDGAAAAGMPAELRLRAADHAEAAAAVRDRVERDFAVLVKGSRGMRMEQVVHELLEGEN